MPAKYELVDLGGKLALYHISLTLQDRPAFVDCYYVSSIDAKLYTHILGHVPWFPSGTPFRGNGTVRNSWGGGMRIDCHDWVAVEIETAIPKPRDGREYTWKWCSWGKWEKDSFPRCENCGHYHDPAFIYCVDCGHCYRMGKKHVCGE
jgi:hypothetical protein